jgi:glycosyltransferase involved in cell wall biosynthesis
MEGKKVLILAHKPPYPKIDGGCIAISQIVEVLLNAGMKVHFLGMETKKHPSKKPITHTKLNYKTVKVNTTINPWGALRNFFSKSAYFTSRFSQVKFEKELVKTLKNQSFDLVIFESLFTSSYIDTVRKYSNAKTVYRSHNIEHVIWESYLLTERNPLKKAYLNFQIKRLKKEELAFWNTVDSIASISNKDSEYINLHIRKPISTIGLYCNDDYLTQKDQNEKVDFFHLGAMDWQPNDKAISWLLENVWEIFQQKNTEAELHIAGRGMSDKLINTNLPGLTNHKEVADAVKFLSAHKVMLVPLFSGSGIRVKIIEGMALGKCIISTTIGCEGINATHLENILIANTKEEFIEQMHYCLNNPNRVTEIGANAQQFAISNFSKSEISEQLKNLFR